MDTADTAAPYALIESPDASVRDIATGSVTDAGEVQSEIRRMLADYERAHPPAERPSDAARRPGAA